MLIEILQPTRTKKKRLRSKKEKKSTDDSQNSIHTLTHTHKTNQDTNPNHYQKFDHHANFF